MARGFALIAAACLLLADCAHVRSPPPSPPRPRPPARTTAPTPAPRVYSEHDVAAERSRLARALSRGGQGAVATDEAGYFLDVLQGRMLQRVGARFAISRQDNRLTLRPSPGATWFASDGSLTAEGVAALAAVAPVLAEYRRTLVIVRASSSGPGDARQRVLSVLRVLSEAGLDRRRLLPVTAAAAGPPLELQVEPVMASR